MIRSALFWSPIAKGLDRSYGVILHVISLVVLLGFNSLASAQLVVLNARGLGLKPGQTLPLDATVELKEGAQLSVIAADGKTLTLRGPYTGPVLKKGSEAPDPKKALRVLISSRDARTSSVGVIRAGTLSVQTPDPYAIDLTRPGPRCLLEGRAPVFWRPEPYDAKPFVVFPADRSWRADLRWEEGEATMPIPRLSRFEGPTTFIVNLDQKEFAIGFSIIPVQVKDPVVLTAWMFEQGCLQQADALLRQLQNNGATEKAANVSDP